MKPLIVFATPAEAAATLHRFHAERDAKDCHLYQSTIGPILVPGMGVLAVAQAICRYGHLANEIWNFGAAGALRDGFQLEQLFIHRDRSTQSPSSRLCLRTFSIVPETYLPRPDDRF